MIPLSSYQFKGPLIFSFSTKVCSYLNRGPCNWQVLYITTTARFLESDLIEILRRSSKEPVGGAVHKWKLWPLPCSVLLLLNLCTAPPALCLLLLLLLLTAPPDIPLLLLLTFLYCSFYCNGFFTAPPSPISLLLLPASDYGSFTAPPSPISLLLLPASDYGFFTAPPSPSLLLLLPVQFLCTSKTFRC